MTDGKPSTARSKLEEPEAPTARSQAPASAGKSGRTIQGRGGPSRTASVNGGSGSGSESFPYVPPDGGAISEGDAELLLNYQKSLTWAKKLFAVDSFAAADSQAP